MAYAGELRQVTWVSGTPATPNEPSSSTDVLRGRLEHPRPSSMAFSSSSSDALPTALPPICSEREPPVPPPRGMIAVSDCS